MDQERGMVEGDGKRPIEGAGHPALMRGLFVALLVAVVLAATMGWVLT
jgi:hypothetical protein